MEANLELHLKDEIITEEKQAEISYLCQVRDETIRNYQRVQKWLDEAEKNIFLSAITKINNMLNDGDI